MVKDKITSVVNEFFLCFSGVEEIADGMMEIWLTNLIELYRRMEDDSERQRFIEIHQNCRSARGYINENAHPEYLQMIEDAHRLAKEKGNKE